VAFDFLYTGRHDELRLLSILSHDRNSTKISARYPCNVVSIRDIDTAYNAVQVYDIPAYINGIAGSGVAD